MVGIAAAAAHHTTNQQQCMTYSTAPLQVATDPTVQQDMHAAQTIPKQLSTSKNNL